MDKTAIVTGGARGIGRAVSALLCRKGYNVLINYNSSEESALKLVSELKRDGLSAVAYKCDVSDKCSVDKMFEFVLSEFGSVDVLVANAGIASQKLFTDVSEEEWSKLQSVDLGGCFYCNQAAARIMVKQHSGAIVNVSSVWGVTGASCEVAYSAAKSGVIGLTKALAKELGPSGIRVNAVAPGVIKTDMLASFSEKDLASLADETPLCRLGTPEDVAEAVAFLTSDSAAFITGQVLHVDGGFVI